MGKRVIVIDNYDSFTYNLVHLLRALDVADVTVVRNDKTTLAEVEKFDKILLSPGPGIPMEAGLMPQIVEKLAPKKSILGVCLGHQCIGEVFGGTLVNMSKPVHGKGCLTSIIDTHEPLFHGLPERFTTGRYHSWLVGRKNFPDCLKITACDSEGDIMALTHAEFDVRGVQFHPESVLTEHGAEMMKNWMKL